MIIRSIKVNIKKVALFIIFIAAAVALLFLLSGRDGAVETSGTPTRIKNSGITTNEKRVEFLEQFGWGVRDPIEIVEITIPDTFDMVYENYNQLQKKQGFDLSKYKGKRAKRYTYIVENFDDGELRANLIIYNGKVIAGDLMTPAENGIMTTLYGE